MSLLTTLPEVWSVNRDRTVATLDVIAELPDPQRVLGWRPGEGRAHVAWQLMHIAITEELFARERLIEGTPGWPELIPRYRGGSTPDENIPPLSEIREILRLSRAHLQDTLADLTEEDLQRVPPPMAERNWTIEFALKVLTWHEPHHQGQAHITLNLWKAQHGL